MKTNQFTQDTTQKKKIIIIKDEPVSSFEPTPKMAKKKTCDKFGGPTKEKETPEDNQLLQR